MLRQENSYGRRNRKTFHRIREHLETGILTPTLLFLTMVQSIMRPGDGNCGVKLTLSKDGTRITQNWRNAGFDSYMGGIVKIGDFIYGCGTAKNDIRSINVNSGLITDSLRVGSGALITADNKLYYYNQKGELILPGL
jgi:hypothetical protein